MTRLPVFRLEEHFDRWEFTARHNLAASDMESMTLAELLAMAGPDDRETFDRLWLGYTKPQGSDALRAAIAAGYERIGGDDVLVFVGAEEGLYAAMQVLLRQGDHAVVVTPNYQAAESVPLSICAVSGVPLDPGAGWSLDLDRVAAAIRPETRLVSINFPHNPTGAVLSPDRLAALIALCRARGIWLFSDEVYRGIGRVPPAPQVADLYERGLSLNVMSKAYGLPGLRIGWIACQDRGILQQLTRMKDYLSICNPAPSEVLAMIALKAREQILARNNALVRTNLDLVDTFFAEYPGLFSWQRPAAGCVGVARYHGAEGVEVFARDMVETAGVLVLPASLYRSDLAAVPADFFRIGFGRAATADAVSAMRAHLQRNDRAG